MVRPVYFAWCLALSLLLCGCGNDVGVERVEWPVMGTAAAVQTKGDRDGVKTGRIAAATMAAFKDVEVLLNAHSPTSEISRLARLSDAEVVKSCAREMLPCYEAAFMLRTLTGGAFDPRWRGAGTLDLGAIAKGFAVDLAVERVSAPQGVALLVDLGGNVKAARGRWRVGVKNPFGSGFAAAVDLAEGESLATSATYFRGSHIRDGRTGAVVSNGVASVTVLCNSAMLADGLSTALFVLGPDEGRAFLDAASSGCPQLRPTAVLWIMSGGERVAFGSAGRFR